MTVGREQDHSLVCLDIGQLLSLEVGWVVVKLSVLERTAGVATEITVGGVFSAIFPSNLGAEGPSEDNVTTFVVANMQASGVSEAARVKSGPGIPGVDTITTTWAAATTTACVAVATSRAAPAACTTAPSTRGAGRVSEGVILTRLMIDPSGAASKGRRKAG